ncbi:50S ribosomal protein L35 [Desulfomonile tiedjei]|uniref:Large ribosomal subunit protein bL35 n=1 Tax=Desulfomonile tiedjei (strain ATCC 49306 / DSM 6799 / DCB-1) TaxID=706587 RepID=I4CA96_DESTA|nr:50S ribosomal protein L35 [Desulfomonile tiedjei]AFM26487.1 ribosomal protein L35 [Desulfomonile tiedjei DSM 6799]
MPKIKSNRGAAKRFTILKSGKVKRKKAYHSHILTSKSTKQKRNLRGAGYIDDTNLKQIHRLLPYG